MSVLDLSPFAVVNTILLGLVLCLISAAFYNVFFHPLRNYPGPRFLAASGLPSAYGKITGGFSLWTLDLHKKYGPVVRMAPNELSYSNSSSWQDIYASNSARPNGMPRDTSFFASIEDENAVPSLVTASDKDHSRIRSNFAKAFSEQALAQQRPLIIGHVNTLMKKLHEVHHEDINIVNMFNFTIADILANLSFGEPMHLLNDETHRAWVHNQFGCVRSSRILATLTDFPIFRAIFHVTLSGLVKRARVTYFGWMNKKIDHRLTKGVDGPDTIHFVTQGEKGLTEPELRSNLPLILFAGLDTLSAALSGLVAFLVEAPETLQQLQDEVRSTFPESSAIDAPTMKNMKLLNACINEILRIYPGAPGEFPRVVPAGGAMISGKWVPAGIRVYTSPLGAFRSPANFHDPDSFHPERWYTETDEKFSADDRNACKPFSIGTSDCVGQRMAKYLLQYIVCELILQFDIKARGDSKAWFSKQGIWTAWDKPPLMVKLTPVKAL